MPDEPEELPKVLNEITRVIESGERIDTTEYLEKYPALAPELKRFFETRAGGGREAGFGPGAVIDDYRIVRELGRGGMGVVYEAEQVSLQRKVALKVVTPSVLHSRSAYERFKREANAVARLSHDRVVLVHGFGQSGGVSYLAMEYVPGLNLAEIIDRLKTAKMHGRRYVRVSGEDLEKDLSSGSRARRLTGTPHGEEDRKQGIVLDLRNYAQLAASFALDATEALAHAHAHGVVHRDVKPSNLILDRASGRIKLSDFGLAKGTEDGSITGSGDFLGSPAYVSPELASGKRGKVDARSDVYGVGVTLYELITLVQPFTGKDVAQTIRAILTAEPVAPGKLDPRIPRDLETIVLKCLEKDPANRYQSADELAEDLRRFLNYDPIVARPVARRVRLLRAARRHRSGLALTALGVLVLALGGTVLFSKLDLGRRQRLVRDIDAQLQSREGAGAARGVLAVMDELSKGLDARERRERIDAVADEARALLDADSFGKVEDLLDLIDARADLGAWSVLEGRLLEIGLRDVKIDFVARLEDSLSKVRDPPLSQRERREGLASLERLLADRDPMVCKSAAVALGTLRDPTSLGALADALGRRNDAEGRIAIIGSLRALGDAGAVPFLKDELSDEDEWVRFAALEALDELDPPALDTLVTRLQSDPRSFVRDRVRAILARLAHEPGP